MPDTSVTRWKQSGQVAMWRSDQRDNWSLSADSAGCDSLNELLNLVIKAQWSSSVIVKLALPKQTAFGPSKQLQTVESFTLSFPKESVNSDHWEFEIEENLTLELGSGRIIELLGAIEDIRNGKGDYSIGPSRNPLWIWWWVDS